MSSIDREMMESLVRSGQFDEAWYLAAYPDVARTGLSAAEHFVKFGRLLGRHTNGKAFATHKGRNNRDYSSKAFSLVEGNIEKPQKSAPSLEPTPLPVGLRARVESSGLFDPSWYVERYADLMAYDDPLQDYLECLDTDVFRDPGPLFSTSEYLRVHKDVRGIHPFIHFVDYGLREGRSAFSCKKVNEHLNNAELGHLTKLEDLLDRNKPTVVLHWAGGNFFFSEIAEYTARYLTDIGFPAKSFDDYRVDSLSDVNTVVVAPHEFCVYGPGKDWSDEHLSHIVFLNTEQWHTSWFSLTYRFTLLSRKALDINPSSAAGFLRIGVRCGFIPLLPLASSCFDHPQAPLDAGLTERKFVKELTFPGTFMERPYDVLYLATMNERRERALASLAPELSGFDCFLHSPKFDRPVRKGDADMIGNRDFAQLARNSKILLNIHQGESRYFEWHRLFLSGIMEGCVVLTEPCTPIGIVRPNEHYLEFALEDLGGALEHYLRSDEGRKELERINENCRALRKQVAAGERFVIQ